MEVKENIPIVLFDNQCYLCMKFAKMVNFFARDKITMVGHYSEFGKKIRDTILDDSALDMFWFINQKRACGGRAALFPLLKSILFEKQKNLQCLKLMMIVSKIVKQSKQYLLDHQV